MLHAPITGCAMSPEIGPASQTRLVSVSDNPRERRNGVPYLSVRIRINDLLLYQDGLCARTQARLSKRPATHPWTRSAS